MRDRILRLTAPLLIIITLLLGVCPHHAAGQAQTATTYHTYIPLVIGSGDTPAPAPSTDTFSEVSAARTAYSDLAIANINGRMVARIRRYAEPNGYYDTASASWQAIEPQLIADGDSYRNTAAGFTARFRSGGTQQILQLGRPGEAILTLSLPAGIAPAPVADTTTITYPNALGTASLVYHSQPWGVKEELVIDAPGGPSSYSLHLDAPGLVPQRQDDGDYLLSDSAGNAIWRIPAPVGADASGAEAALDLSISNSDSGLLVQLSIDPPWLSDPARSYPIRLDPSLVDPQYIGGESYVQSAAPTIVSYNQRNRFIGYSALKGITRLYTPIDLSILPESIAPDQILAARLVLTQYVADSATAGFASSVYTVPSAWSDLTLNWNNQPATGSRVSGAQISRDLEQKRWDITDWVRTVVTDQTSNHGLTIRADQEMLGGGIFWSSFCYPAFCSAPSDRPFLEFEIALDSGLDPLRDTWAWPNREGQPSFAQYADDYGIAETTHVVTETRVLQTLSYTDVLHLPIRFAPLGIDASIPLSITEGLTSTTTSDPSPVLIPRPLSYLYEEVVVKAIYDDAFSADYTAAMQGGLCMGMAATVADFYANGGPTPDELGGGETVRSIPDQAAAQDFIQTYHGRQIGSQVLNWLADQGRMDVRAYYERLVARIGQAAWRSDPEIIGILKGASCEDMEIGHALLPYKVVPAADARVRVYVYDPNDPPTAADDVANRYIELDLASGTWSYELAPATASRPAVIWVGRDLFSLPLHLLREKPIQP
ncbi:MAG: DNRLRE domain-containing protein, partial [Oscillochloris sp.]|nr:DNRLRE domain-containing protein [Oscillochloris sp.]